MSDFQKIIMSINSISSTPGTNCDISFDILIEKFLSQYSKERYSSEMKEQDEKKVPTEFAFAANEMGTNLNLGFNMWHSVGPMKTNDNNLTELTHESIHRTQSDQCLEGKAKMVCELLSELKPHEKETLSKTFLVMSSSPECCAAIKRLKCLPILVGLIHDKESNKTVREFASETLQRVVQYNSENKQGRRETLVFKQIEQILKYCELRQNAAENRLHESEIPVEAVALLMKFSFDEEHRRAMCDFGALHTLAVLIENDHEMYNGDVLNLSTDSITIRRYAAMALTNLTFKDSNNKSLLCSFKQFMRALVFQLQSPNEDLCQVTASVLRNLSWRADTDIKNTLRDIEAVKALVKTALRVKKESTLKAVLSALWNLSAHSNLNKVDICNVDGSIEYLVKMLNYQAPSGTMTIVENIGGILRNVSSLIAVRDDYRSIIRKYNCLYVLLNQLKSPSLTIVSNACGTLWNLSARCNEDQQTLIQLGAIDMLRSLIHSKHKMISVACSAALKNLNTRNDANIINNNRSGTLMMRKRRNLEQELDAIIQESCDNVEGQISDGCEFMMPTNSEHAFSGKNESLRNSELTSIHSYLNTDSKRVVDDLPVAQNMNLVRFSVPLCDDEKNKENENPSTQKCKSPLTSIKGILNRTDDGTKLKENSFSFNGSCEEEEEPAGKMNGFCKMEESYNMDDPFGDYAETDLDEPTNYSLRFGEQNRMDIERNEMMVTGSIECSPTNKKVEVMENLCLETPLMFSRSSSLGSVGSCSEPGDDHGSVVSEFSHAVSGVISPSDLPASPSETVPASPCPTAKSDTFYLTDTKPKLSVHRSVFEDTVTIFKDENTPNQFSVATSLSSLTFEDEPHIVEELASVAENSILENQTHFHESNTVNIKEPIAVEKYEEKEDCFDLELSPEEQQAVLNACIDSGQRTTQKYCKIKEKKNYSVPNHSSSSLNENNRNLMMASTLVVDSTINYCTEDTPISISHAASNSDLSLLCPSEDSFLQNSILPLSSCMDEDVSELPVDEQEKLLNMCIATGQSLNYNSNDSIDLGRSSQSSTLSEITEDLPVEDKTLLKDMTESANLITTTLSSTENDYSFVPDVDSKELSDEQSENLLNQCIALGMRNMKDSTASDLENIGPPSFLADANLDSSLTNVEEISDYPLGKKEGKCTPKQKRHQFKERYNTYTIKLSPSKSSQKSSSESFKKNLASKERRSVENDRFKTRILSKGDFEEIAKDQKNNKSSKSPVQNELEETNTNLDYENVHDSGRGKTGKSTARVKSGIPIVKGKQPAAKNLGSIRSNLALELPVNLQRQNTFTKEESSGIPVRKDSFRTNSKSNILNESNNQFKSAIPSRIKEPSPKIGRIRDSMECRSPDIVKNRWSVSDNNLNATSALKATNNVNLNASPMHAASKVSPSISNSALPVRKETSHRNSNYVSYKK